MFAGPHIVATKTPATACASSRGPLAVRKRLFAAMLLVAWVLAPACEPALPDYTGGGISLPGYETEYDGGSDADDGDEGERDALPCGDDQDGIFAASDISISEIARGENGFVELHWNGTEPLHLNGVSFEGALTASPAGTLEAEGKHLFRTAALPASGELGLVFGGALVDYVCWGAVVDSPLHEEAFLLGLWQANGSCALQPAAGQSLHLRGSGLFPGDYVTAPPSPLGCVE